MRRVDRKKHLAGLVVILMLLALLPVTAMAASANYGDFLVTGDDLSGVSFESDTLTIGASGTYTVSMAQEGETTGQHITVSSGVTATLVLDGVSVSSNATALELSGAEVTLVLSEGSDNSFVSTGAGSSAIHVPTGSMLTIRCDSSEAEHVCDENCGSLTAQYTSNTSGPAAIGGNTTESTGSISIQGGVVNASNIYGVAIGGGGGQFYGGDGGAADVSISGGIVTATTFDDAAIGGGTGADGWGAGAGGNPGTGGSGGQADISITGGVVNTQGGAIGGGTGGRGGYNYYDDDGTGGDGGDAGVSLTGGIVNAGRIGAGEGGSGGTYGSAGNGLIETGAEGSCFVIADQLITSSDPAGFTGTFVIDGNGRVYSDMSLYDDVVLPEGATLTIPDGVVLTVPTDVAFTNNGSVEGQGEIDNYGSVLGNQPNVTVNEMVATISVAGGEGGSVTGGGNFETGRDVVVTATPEAGYHFLGWMENGQLVSNSARYEFSATADRSLTAVFEQHKSGQDDGDCTTPVYCEICGDVARAAQKHQFSEWLSGNGTHTRHCMNADCTVTEEASCTGGIATCTEKAVCEVCGGEYGELDAANHTHLVKVEAKSPTQTQDGNTTYWHCEDCGRYFSDEALTNEITVEDTVIPAGSSPQTEDNGGPLLWGALLSLLSGGAAGALIYKKRKA